MQVMKVLHQQSLQSYNTFGILARAQTMVRITRPSDVLDVLRDPLLGASPKFVLGGGSNLVLTGDVSALVLRMIAPTSLRPKRVRTGMTLSPGPWSKAGLVWKTWH